MIQVDPKYLIIGALGWAFVAYVFGAKQVLNGIKTQMCTDANYASKSASLQVECPNISTSEIVDYYYIPSVPIIGDITKSFVLATIKK